MNFSDYGISVSGSGQRMTKCPRCSPGRKKHHLKTLSVNIEKGVWNCHHCDFSGSLGTYKIEHSKKYKMTVKEYKKPEPVALTSMPNSIMKWFNDRGISGQTVKNCGITYERAWMPQTEKKEHCMIFNYYIGNDYVNKKYRDNSKNMKLASGARLIMYAPSVYDIYQESEEIYITEGEPDSLATVEIGIKNVLSTPNGAPPENVTIENVDLSYLESIAELAPKAKKYILMMDSDKVGLRLRNEIGRRLGNENCYFVTYPDDCKDINDVLVKHGKQKAVDCAKNIKPFPIEGKYNVSDMFQSVFTLYDNGIQHGTSFGMPGIENLYSIKTKQFTIVTGIPSHGKSSWLDCGAVNMAKIHKWKFGIFSPENYPFENHIAKLCELFIGKPFFKSYNGHMDENELQAALEFLNSHFFFLMPKTDDVTVDDVLSLAKASIFQNGIKGLIIDPWNELEHNRGKMSETDYISQSLTKIRKFSRVNDIHTWIVAHPTKLQKLKDGSYPVPTPYDISGSAHWRNKADNCICVHRDFEEGSTKIFIQKIRFKEVGKVGDSTMYFNIKNNRFQESRTW